MATDNRVFISFAIEDANLRTLLVGQARNEASPFSFVDMSVKEPWDSSWKTKCRTKIKGCDGVIGIITDNTPTGSGQIWELACAVEENVPVFLIYGNEDRPSSLPASIKGKRVHLSTWPNIEKFLDTLG